MSYRTLVMSASWKPKHNPVELRQYLVKEIWLYGYPAFEIELICIMPEHENDTTVSQTPTAQTACGSSCQRRIKETCIRGKSLMESKVLYCICQGVGSYYQTIRWIWLLRQFCRQHDSHAWLWRDGKIKTSIANTTQPGCTGWSQRWHLSCTMAVNCVYSNPLWLNRNVFF